MKKLLSIICCIAMLCSISVLTASADTESDRMHEAFIYNAKNETEAYFIYDDFDGNGSYEAFGITGSKTDEGDYPNANIYFINNDMSVTKVNEKVYGGTLSQFDNNNVLSAGSSKFVVWDENYRGPGSTAHIYGVKNGSLYEPKVSGEYSGIKPDGDAFILGKSVSQGVRRYDEYRFKFDDSSKEFVEDTGTSNLSLKTNAVDLAKMDLNNIITMIGGEYDVVAHNNYIDDKHSFVGNGSYTNFYYIKNDDLLPGIKIFTDYLIDCNDEDYENSKNEGKLNSEAASRVRSELQSGKYKLLSIVAEKGNLLDNNIKPGINYTQYKDIVGNCDCFYNADSRQTSTLYEDDNVSVTAVFDYNPDNITENHPVSDDEMTNANPVIRYCVWKPLKESDTKSNIKTYTAEELLSKSISDIVNIMGGNYELDGSIMEKIDHRSNHEWKQIYICNDNILPGFKIYLPKSLVTADCFGKDGKVTQMAKDNLKQKLSGVNEKPQIVMAFNGAKVDNNITSDMSYNNLTRYYGEFDCVAADNLFGYLIENDKGETIGEFSFDPAKVTADTKAAAMKANNPKLNYVVIYQGYEAVNNSQNGNSDNTDGTGNNNTSNNDNTIKSPATSTLGANSTIPLLGIAVVLLIAIAGCISSIKVYRRRKDTI